MIKNPLLSRNMAVVVVGLGLTGISAVRYLHAQGAKVYVSEVREKNRLSEAEKEVLARCCKEYEGGGHTAEFLGRGEMIFVSPGISRHIPALQKVSSRGVPVVGELELAAPVLRQRVVAITGTNGKTTVTTLVGQLLKEAGKKVFIGGNIGRPLLECLMTSESFDEIVLEVSSFQLEEVGDFRPDIGMILNITPDHLDRHGSIAEYVLAKANLFKNQQSGDIAIICTDNTICMQLADHLCGSEPLLFGHSNDCHGYICGSSIYARHNGGIEMYSLENTVFDNQIGRLNCAAAILAALHCGCTRSTVERVLRSFQPLSHRMEIVAEFEGVLYCNDSKATNTGAVISALSQCRGSVILIAGGKDKGDDYGLLTDVVREKVSQLILIGEAAAAIAGELTGIVTIHRAESMEDAVAIAYEAAEPGNTVLLSPACASFDMFDSYAHRGRVFSQCVASLQARRSVRSSG